MRVASAGAACFCCRRLCGLQVYLRRRSVHGTIAWCATKARRTVIHRVAFAELVHELVHTSSTIRRASTPLVDDAATLVEQMENRVVTARAAKPWRTSSDPPERSTCRVSQSRGACRLESPVRQLANATMARGRRREARRVEEDDIGIGTGSRLGVSRHGGQERRRGEGLGCNHH